MSVLILWTIVRLTNLFIHRYSTNGRKTLGSVGNLEVQDCAVNYEVANRA